MLSEARREKPTAVKKPLTPTCVALIKSAGCNQTCRSGSPASTSSSKKRRRKMREGGRRKKEKHGKHFMNIKSEEKKKKSSLVLMINCAQCESLI